jgi:hypothetical protein
MQHDGKFYWHWPHVYQKKQMQKKNIIREIDDVSSESSLEDEDSESLEYYL